MSWEEFEDLCGKIFCYPVGIKNKHYLNFYYREDGIDSTEYEDIIAITKKMYYPDMAKYAKSNNLKMLVEVLCDTGTEIVSMEDEEIQINHSFFENNLMIPSEIILKVGDFARKAMELAEMDEDEEEN